MRRAAWVVLTLMLGCGPAAASEAKERQAAAEAWLGLVDQGAYGRSWDQAAPFLKNAISRVKWHEALRAFREPLGALVGRSLKSRQYATELPGAPDGEYVVIQFATEFENKQNGVETVTPMLAADGAWRIAGYFIR